MKAIHLLLPIIGLLLLWQIVIYIFKLPPYILPPPWSVAHTWVTQVALLWTQTKPTLIETLLGLLLGALSGSIGALILISFKTARLWLLPLLVISQAIPIFAIAPLFVIWFGYGEISKVVTTMLMIFFPVTTAFYDGLRRTDATLLGLAKTMNASRFAILWQILIPSALPALASGLRVATAIAPLGAIVGEWVGSSHGLGFLILNANARMQIDLMFAALLTLTLLTLLLYYVVDKLLHWAIFWQADIAKP